MIETVKFSGTTYADIPTRFEAGTQNINAVPTLRPAIEMLEWMRESGAEKDLEGVSSYILEALSSRDNIRVYGKHSENGVPLFSFTVEGAHHEDLALILDKMGIAVLSGQMCAEPLMDRFGVTGMLRVSLLPYNTMGEAEYFIKCLDKAIKMLV